MAEVLWVSHLIFGLVIINMNGVSGQSCPHWWPNCPWCTCQKHKLDGCKLNGNNNCIENTECVERIVHHESDKDHMRDRPLICCFPKEQTQSGFATINDYFQVNDESYYEYDDKWIAIEICVLFLVCIVNIGCIYCHCKNCYSQRKGMHNIQK